MKVLSDVTESKKSRTEKLGLKYLANNLFSAHEIIIDVFKLKLCYLIVIKIENQS